MPLKPGDKAPDFTLLDQNGEPFSLSKSLKARKVWHLIYFYPRNTRS
jgi:peroxiredoxin